MAMRLCHRQPLPRAFLAAVLFGCCAVNLTAARPLWVRVPTGHMPDDSWPFGKQMSPYFDQKGSPEQWWNATSNEEFMKHNILMETAMYDPSFRKQLLVNNHMKVMAQRQTNYQRANSIMQCVAALTNFINERVPEARGHWYPEGGTLLGAVRNKGFIPWDSDGDVTFTENAWKRVQAYLRKVQHSGNDRLPKPSSVKCGCLILDTKSFGSQRPSTSDKWVGIPGRCINECSGNYVDIFLAIPTGMGRYKLSSTNAHGSYSFSSSTIFPLGSCVFSGISMMCPNNPVGYLSHYYSDPMTDDHAWSEKKCAWVQAGQDTGTRDGQSFNTVTLWGECKGSMANGNYHEDPLEKAMNKMMEKAMMHQSGASTKAPTPSTGCMDNKGLESYCAHSKALCGHDQQTRLQCPKTCRACPLVPRIASAVPATASPAVLPRRSAGTAAPSQLPATATPKSLGSSGCSDRALSSWCISYTKTLSCKHAVVKRECASTCHACPTRPATDAPQHYDWTQLPTSMPTRQTDSPTALPTGMPTGVPRASLTVSPTASPTRSPPPSTSGACADTPGASCSDKHILCRYSSEVRNLCPKTCSACPLQGPPVHTDPPLHATAFTPYACLTPGCKKKMYLKHIKLLHAAANKNPVHQEFRKEISNAVEKVLAKSLASNPPPSWLD